jgi:hypothetical protein
LTGDFELQFIEPLKSDVITKVSEEEAKSISCSPAIEVKEIEGLEFNNVLDGAKKVWYDGCFAVTSI